MGDLSMNPVFSQIQQAVIHTNDLAHLDLQADARKSPDADELEEGYKRRMGQVMELKALSAKALHSFTEAGAPFDTTDPMLRALFSALNQ
jgi:hypothetical protein